MKQFAAGASRAEYFVTAPIKTTERCQSTRISYHFLFELFVVQGKKAKARRAAPCPPYLMTTLKVQTEHTLRNPIQLRWVQQHSSLSLGDIQQKSTRINQKTKEKNTKQKKVSFHRFHPVQTMQIWWEDETGAHLMKQPIKLRHHATSASSTSSLLVQFLAQFGVCWHIIITNPYLSVKCLHRFVFNFKLQITARPFNKTPQHFGSNPKSQLEAGGGRGGKFQIIQTNLN